jgi:hypothetical protein
MYGKWFASTYTGSMLGAGASVFAVWGWIIANCQKNGVVEINPKLLATVIGEDISEIENAIQFLLQPDPESRSGTEEGRRIVHEGGYQYLVVNHGIYRRIRDEEERREYNRIKKRQSRARQAASTGKSNLSAHTDTEAEAEAEAGSVSTSYLPVADATKRRIR